VCASVWCVLCLCVVWWLLRLRVVVCVYGVVLAFVFRRIVCLIWFVFRMRVSVLFSWLGVFGLLVVYF